MRGENIRFWLPVVALLAFAGYCSQKLVRSHIVVDVSTPDYDIDREIPGRRGSIYDASDSRMPIVKSMPVWRYHLDPEALEKTPVKFDRKSPRRSVEAILKTVSVTLNLDYQKLLKMAKNKSNRYQFLCESSDPDAHKTMVNRRVVAGVAVSECQRREYLQGRRLAHVVGSVNAEGVGTCGIEQRYNRELSGVAGRLIGRVDAFRHEIYEKRIEKVSPIPGCDIFLTVDNNLQYEAETALQFGLDEFGAASGWCVALNAKTGAVLAMASLPAFEPRLYGRSSDDQRRNRAIANVYEPGSVMKVITAAAGIEQGMVKPESLFSTDRHEEGYVRLPGDGSHVWEPRMTLSDAVAHSSNIVIGKLAYLLGPETLHGYLTRFGFGAKTGIELPGEERGLVRPWRKWDRLTWSRAGIGQGVAVTAIQVASAYQAIANDGVRMRPYVVSKIVGADGEVKRLQEPEVVGHPVSLRTARDVRTMMLGVASAGGTARRAALVGYSVAGKTGTAQKRSKTGKGYAAGLYCATFCGIVPSGVVYRDPKDEAPVPAELVILVSLDFEKPAKYHQGGNSSAVVFRRFATAALRYLQIEPDRPDELMEYRDTDDLDRIMDARAAELSNGINGDPLLY